MSLSLIEELPKIVKEGRAEAARILERINSGNALALQTNELVLPSKDVSCETNYKYPKKWRFILRGVVRGVVLTNNSISTYTI